MNNGYKGDKWGKAEDKRMRRINEKLLEQFQAVNHSSKPYGILPDKEIIIENAKESYLERMAIKKENIILKDPRTTILHRYWLPNKYIAIYRHPNEVVLSYIKEMKEYFDDYYTAYDTFMEYWLRFNKSVLFCLYNYPGGILLKYDHTIDDQLRKLFNHLGIKNPKLIQDTRTITDENEIKDTRAKEMYNQLNEKQANQWK